MSQSLVFVHLSDIHFRKRENGDPDAELRNELEQDVERMATRLGHVDGILVTGDIAFAGRRAEYDEASHWLDSLAALVQAPVGRIWAVPGNHDVDREALKRNSFIGLLHDKIRPSLRNDAPREIADWVDSNLDHWLEKGEGDVLFEAIEDYNRFAMRVGCDSRRARLTWEEDLPLNDGSVLRLWGINSALLSGPSDNIQDKRLVIGRRQSLPPTRVGVTYLALCHHPPRWLCEEDHAGENLCARVAIQLFGHRHRQRVNRVDNSLVVSAGAVHPSPDEPDWEPRYNLLQIEVIHDPAGGRLLRVTVWPRVYRDSRRFQPDVDPDGAQCRTFEFSLPSCERAAEATAVPPTVAASSLAVPVEQQPVAEEAGQSAGSAPSAVTGPAEPPEASMSMSSERQAERQLVYRFFGLGYADIMTIAAELGLFSNDDEGIKDTERFQRYYRRAKERGLVERLRELVEARYVGASRPSSSRAAVGKG